MIHDQISRRKFVLAASLLGAGIASGAFADEPDAPEIPEPVAAPEVPETPVVSEKAEAEAAPLTLFNEWLAEDIDGGGVIDNAQTSLLVAEDGSVSGRGGCNRFSGKAKIDGQSISFGTIASTRMACADALMNQERKFFEALGKVATFRIDQTERKLVLLDADDKALVTLTSIS